MHSAHLYELQYPIPLSDICWCWLLIIWCCFDCVLLLLSGVFFRCCFVVILFVVVLLIFFVVVVLELFWGCFILSYLLLFAFFSDIVFCLFLLVYGGLFYVRVFSCMCEWFLCVWFFRGVLFCDLKQYIYSSSFFFCGVSGSRKWIDLRIVAQQRKQNNGIYI